MDNILLPHLALMRFFSFFNVNTDVKGRSNTQTLLFLQPSPLNIMEDVLYYFYGVQTTRKDFIF